MAFDEDQLARLEKAIALGVTRVKFADREQDFRSLKEMNQLRNQMKRELGGKSKSTSSGRRYAAFSKGIR